MVSATVVVTAGATMEAESPPAAWLPETLMGLSGSTPRKAEMPPGSCSLEVVPKLTAVPGSPLRASFQ